MDISYNKVDQTALPISQDRVSASEYNQIAASLMHIITASGLTPDSEDNAQLLTALGPRIVETYSNGTSWYRVWSDGWCEQGGEVSNIATGSGTFTVTFLKPFPNSDYTLTFGTFGTGYNSAEANFRCTAYTSTTCTFYNNSGTITTYKWQASGYIS